MLTRAIKSLQGASDRIVYVDGAYQAFGVENDSYSSTDASMSIARRMGVKVVDCFGKPWKNQVEKRNQYLLGKNGDYYLMLDADEEFRGEIYIDGEDVYRIYVYDCIKKSYFPWIRLFKHRQDLCYKGGHNILWYGNKMIRENMSSIMLSATINHYYFERSNDRKKRKQKYYEKQLKEERAFRLKHGCP